MVRRETVRPTKVVLDTDAGVDDAVAIVLAANAPGIDLVAMSVNDMLVIGAEPLFFLDYLAVHTLEPAFVADLVKGIAEGCRTSDCALIGGETAEMPGMYDGEDYDLAGFCVGVVEKSQIIDGSAVKDGDALLGIPKGEREDPRRRVDDGGVARRHEESARLLLQRSAGGVRARRRTVHRNGALRRAVARKVDRRRVGAGAGPSR